MTARAWPAWTETTGSIPDPGRLLAGVFAMLLLVLVCHGLALAGDDSCFVVQVMDDDVLNVRAAPGSGSPIVGTLEPDAHEVHITGHGQMVGNSSWYPVEYTGGAGWVMGRYLSSFIDPVEFCQHPPGDLLDALKNAIANRDGALLASLVDEERGLYLYLDMWSPGLRIRAEQLETIFDDSDVSTWGLDPDLTPVEEGRFDQVVLPVLQRDLLLAGTMGCNAMNHPEAVQAYITPAGTAGINYYSFYRAPGPEDNEFDWGEWVAGVEYWEGRQVLSYLAHYRWEP